jgi:hypothetical protein
MWNRLGEALQLLQRPIFWICGVIGILIAVGIYIVLAIGAAILSLSLQKH